MSKGKTRVLVEDLQEDEGVKQEYQKDSRVRKLDSSGKGDYQVRIHIIEARELKGRDRSGQSDPVVTVSAFGKTRSTAIQKKTTICTWDHMFLWDFKLFDEEFKKGKIVVKVFDANTILRNVEIGSFELDVGFVSTQPGHEVYRRWVALTDSTDKFEGIQGFLKLSVTVLGPGETSPTHDIEADEDAEDPTKLDNIQSMVLLPPKIKTEEWMVNVYIYRGDSFPKLDTFGTCDPFVKVKFSAIKLKTEIKKNTQAPSWDEVLSFPVTLPTMSDLVLLEVYDWDAAAKDELISTVPVKLSDIMEAAKTGNKVGPKWYSMYGSPYPEETKLNVAMNHSHVEPTAFRGRILVAFDAQPTKDGKASKSPTSKPMDPPQQQYLLKCDILEGSELKTKAGNKLSVQVALGSAITTSKEVEKQKNGRIVWYQGLEDIPALLSVNMEDIPDLFINVFANNPLSPKRRIGYIRIPAAKIKAHKDADITWSMLRPDPVVSSSFCGFLQYRLSFGLATEARAIPQLNLQPPPVFDYHFRAFIYQAKGLAAADDTGTSDPYCVVFCGNHKAKTEVKPETINPRWNQVIAFDVQLPTPLSLAPFINVLVYDKDKFSQDDLLGRFTVPLNEISAKVSTPTWYKLFDKDKNKGQDLGEVLASFQIFSIDQLANNPLPTDITPPSKDCILEVSALGLRDMLPFAALPMQKPYIEFSCGEKTVVEKDKNAPNYRTNPSKKPTAYSPNFLEIIEIPVSVPIDPLFAPSVDIQVHDKRLLYNPLVGTASLDLSQFLPWIAANQKKIVSAPTPSGSISTSTDGAGSGSGSQKSTNATPVPFNRTPSDESSPSSSKRTPQDEQEQWDQLADNVKIIIDSNSNDAHRDDESLIGGSGPKDENSGDVSLRTIAEAPESVPFGADDPTPHEDEAGQEDRLPRVEKELEEYYSPPFSLIKVKRGRRKGLNVFEKIAGKGGGYVTTAGAFKGSFRVLEKGDKTQPPPKPLTEMFQPRPYVVRAYILRGIQLQAKDINGSSDPYIVIKTRGQDGRKVHIKDNKNVKKKTLNPEFYECYEIPVNLPAVSELEIEIWDEDIIGGDDLIGTTTIDLENRQFSQKWQQLNPKPIETRNLWNPSSSNPQGKLEMWLEIIPAELIHSVPKTPIGPPVPKNFELRAIIWNTKDCKFRDAEMNDIYVVGYIEGMPSQKTDVHYRSENGEGNFNWRMIFPVTLPYKIPKFKIQLWDRDMLNPNDVIAEANLNLRGFMKKAYKSLAPRQSIPAQFATLTHPNYDGPQGRVEISLEILTEEEARKFPAGKGRGEPNTNPTLAEPNRPDTSFNPLNPFKYISKVLWRKHKGKFICVAVIFALIVLAPLIFMMLKFLNVFV